MENLEPKVSIIIPVYNGANYLGEAIDSALAQTYENLEVIVVNDGSDDSGATDKIAKSYGDRIRYFAKENGGVSTALNLGISVMEGDYFSWLSHDDVYFPEKIDTQVSFLRQLNRDVILYSDYQFIDLNSKFIRTRKLPAVPPENFKLALISSQPLHGCSLLIPKSFFGEVGTFNVNLPTTQDYDLWVKMAERFEFIHLPRVLISSRLHSDQGSKNLSSLWLSECNEFYMKHLSEIITAWNATTAVEPLAVFALKTSIKMERMGLDEPLKMTTELIKENWKMESLRFGGEFYYWFSYYILFRIKCFFLK